MASIEAARRLADILERENDALRDMDLKRATALLAEKTDAFAALTALGEQAVRPNDPAQIAQARRLDALALENRVLLRRAIVAQQRMIGIIVRAAAAAVPDPTYGTTGHRPRLTGAMALSTRA